MIQRLETLYYQCLRYIEQDLAPFHVLVGWTDYWLLTTGG